MTRERAAAIRFQIQLARQAAAPGALRDHGASDDQIREAVRVLVGLRPAGGR